MIFLVCIAIGLVLAACPKIRCVVCHPVSTLRYGAVDLYYYFKHNARNLYHTGELVAYVGLFGKGKPYLRCIGSYPHTVSMMDFRFGVPGGVKW